MLVAVLHDDLTLLQQYCLIMPAPVVHGACNCSSIFDILATKSACFGMTTC